MNKSLPSRIMVGHYSDVKQVLFHPNEEYYLTVSTDMSLWNQNAEQI